MNRKFFARSGASSHDFRKLEEFSKEEADSALKEASWLLEQGGAPADVMRALRDMHGYSLFTSQEIVNSVK